ncbi:hypothetical protein BU23DRAFT_557033 [Bimuria novae-zelandiae CBS 107.79]|uniref:RNI-like protein n=1 Tax=Bimuria novae-zelandiae CBS 107.79 TaxID=1447943 RepID=A0A6A5V0E1_9PLEO|nr:hypothetical protein BU23DRAFT_557033 [Bimuria novae-zelandiae CBS 107.79]
MAPELSRKRKRAHVSYREPSSDDGFSDSDSNDALGRRHPTRRSTRHCSAEVESQSPTASPARTRRKADKRSLRSKGQRKISYRDESTKEDIDEDGEAGYVPLEDVVRTRPRSQAHSRRATPRRRLEDCSRKTNKPARRAIGAPLKEKKKAPHPAAVSIPTDRRKPDMTRLPYHVLLQVFVYASHPLHDENMHTTPAISWLVKMAQMCQAFTKPALTALYRNPPIFAVRQNRKKLVHHLIAPPAGVGQDYKVMVKRLELDATQMSALTDATHSVADLTALVSALTTLKEIDIFDPLDRPPYRERLKRMRKWTYPPELFQALRQTNLRLQGWRWHNGFCAPGQGLLWVKDIHGDRTFQSLRDVTFVKFNVDEKRKSDAIDPTTEELLASAIAALRNLQSLTFESCTAVNGKLLSMLPSTIFSLNITNCINLTSEALQIFLSEKGRNLEELILNHNQSLELSFLTTLKNDCPRLEILRMDLNYYSTLAMSSDNEPLYDWLLGLDEVPTWPPTLRVIDLEHLRKWGADSATNFFTSLIESAAELPFLRELRILAMVDMNWRDRADFRRKWAARFEKVFAWRGPAPSLHLASLRAYREWEEKGSQQKGADRNDSLLDITVENALAENEGAEGSSADSDGETDSDVPLLAKRNNERWNTKRLRNRARASTNYDETSDNEDGGHSGSVDEETTDIASEDDQPTVIQGRCHTVLCRIDNLRPREEMFNEADFLDEERSGDEEWAEDIDEVDESYAW